MKSDVTFETEIYGVPSCLKFDVLKDDIIDFKEGNLVICKYNSENLFVGYVFKKKRNKDGIISVTAYDQLRYLKNKDTLAYDNLTVGDLINQIAYGLSLNTGEIATTNYKIPYRVCKNKSYIDMILSAIDLTAKNTGLLYNLYDDFGAITLKSVFDMVVPILITETNVLDFSYETSIDDEVYNKIRLVHSNSEGGVTISYEASDFNSQSEWGVLQYFGELEEGENGEASARALLDFYNKKKRYLTLNDVLGDIRVRAGCSVFVRMDLGDVITNCFMVVDKCKHKFNFSDEHFMDLELIMPYGSTS